MRYCKYHNVDFCNLSLVLLPRINSLLPVWLPGGHFESGEYVALNPTRLDRSKGSFRIDTETGRWIDFATRDRGSNVISLYRYIRQISWSEALKELSDYDYNFIPTFAKVAKTAKVDKSCRTQDWALRIWEQSCSISETVVEVYLKSRGITVFVPHNQLRYHLKLLHKPSQTHFPAMIAAVKRWPNDEIVAIHRTFLKSDGTGKANISSAKMMLGAACGGAVRFGNDSSHIIIAEGIETALSVYQTTGRATWASLSAANIPNLILPSIEITPSVTMALDNDKAGIEYAEKASKRWLLEGRTVKWALPPKGYDFNDLLREEANHARG